MRATVASWLRDFANVETASAQLGHGDTAVTEAHYLEPAVDAPDATAVLDRLGPATTTTDDKNSSAAASTVVDDPVAE